MRAGAGRDPAPHPRTSGRAPEERSIGAGHRPGRYRPDRVSQRTPQL